MLKSNTNGTWATYTPSPKLMSIKKPGLYHFDIQIPVEVQGNNATPFVPRDLQLITVEYYMPEGRDLLTVRLEHSGYNVETVANGFEAIGAYVASLYEGKKYDLILLDIMMPTVNGHEVLKVIRNEEELRGYKYAAGVPIIMLTALKQQWFQSFEEGCDDYIIKPYEAEELLKKIEEKAGNPLV